MRLYIVRHGKAERDSPSGRDEDRALAPRGRKQAEYLGETIAMFSAPQRPHRIHASPALRAADTARIIRPHLGVELKFEPALGLGTSFEEAIAFARSLIEGGVSAMIVGHNPTFEALVEALSDEERFEMRTGEAAVIEPAPAGAADEPGRLVMRLRLEE